MKRLTKFFAVGALALGLNAFGAGDAHANVTSTEAGDMAIHKKAGLTTTALNSAGFAVGQIHNDTFASLWGNTGTIQRFTVDRIEYRLDIQRPMQGRQNLQLQFGSTTIAAVLIDASLGEVSDNATRRNHQITEFMRKFRGALLASLASLKKDLSGKGAHVFHLGGRYSN